MPSRRFFFLASYGMLCAAPSTVSGQSPALAITHVDFVDVQSGAVMRDRTVVIAGNRIRSVSSAAAAKLRGKVRLIDARGKFLIPGLWDMHVHVRTSASVYFPELVAWGVTGFRETWGNLDSANLWRKKAQAGAISPRFFVAGNLLDGSPVIWPGSDAVDSPARAIEIVDSLHRAGSPFIKVYSQLSREVYYAIAAEAKRLHMPFIGHGDVTLSERSIGAGSVVG